MILDIIKSVIQIVKVLKKSRLLRKLRIVLGLASTLDRQIEHILVLHEQGELDAKNAWNSTKAILERVKDLTGNKADEAIDQVIAKIDKVIK